MGTTYRLPLTAYLRVDGVGALVILRLYEAEADVVGEGCSLREVAAILGAVHLAVLKRALVVQVDVDDVLLLVRHLPG